MESEKIEEKRYYPLGRPATQGAGPVRYILRLPVSPAENAQIDRLHNLVTGEKVSTKLGGQLASLEKRAKFLILKVSGFTSIDDAKAMYAQLVIALARISAATGAALQVPSTLSDILGDDDPNLRLRENISDSEYPPEWGKRANRTRTDGGIFEWYACVLPEHQRIWEYPIWWGDYHPGFSFAELDKYLSDSKNFRAAAIEDKSIRLAIHALWAACDQRDRRMQYILLITALDALAADEKVSNWTEGELSSLMTEIHNLIQEGSKATPESKEKKERLLGTISHAGDPRQADKIRALVLRASGLDKDDPAAKHLEKEMNAVLRKRGTLVHGGKFLDTPTADECKRLREIVATALDQRLRDFGAVSASDTH